MRTTALLSGDITGLCAHIRHRRNLACASPFLNACGILFWSRLVGYRVLEPNPLQCVHSTTVSHLFNCLLGLSTWN